MHAPMPVVRLRGPLLPEAEAFGINFYTGIKKARLEIPVGDHPVENDGDVLSDVFALAEQGLSSV